MQCSDWELAARLLDRANSYLVKDPHYDEFYADVYWVPAPGQLPEYAGGVFKLAPHFPYGYPVEPDKI